MGTVGWGLTLMSNGETLIASDGTHRLQLFDTKTWELTKRVLIYNKNGEKLTKINDLTVLPSPDGGEDRFIIVNVYGDASIYLIDLVT